nr:MAG TPA: hypothetical protein [Caudoviricetes sp.]
MPCVCLAFVVKVRVSIGRVAKRAVMRPIAYLINVV